MTRVQKRARCIAFEAALKKLPEDEVRLTFDLGGIYPQTDCLSKCEDEVFWRVHRRLSAAGWFKGGHNE